MDRDPGSGPSSAVEVRHEQDSPSEVSTGASLVWSGGDGRESPCSDGGDDNNSSEATMESDLVWQKDSSGGSPPRCP
jgi:hypothetical protein